MTGLVWASMGEMARLVATKAVSPVDLVRAHLDRIAALDGKLRAFITVMADSALEAARAAEAAVMRREALGPLHGVPVGLKDLYCTRGVVTTGGSRILRDWVPTEDATVVTRLVAAGGIVLGKLNMHEFAYGPEGLNVHYGTSWNPWDPATHRICGGSSSGSGAAVAAGLCPGALGSDTGGSIRIPSSLCGLTGIKPTYGRVSRAGALPLAWSLDHVGPMCRSAADCALMLGPMSGHDPRDPSTSARPVPDYVAALTGRVEGLRVGLLRRDFLESAGAPQRRAIEQAVRTLEALGASVREIGLERMRYSAGAAAAVISAESYAYHEAWLRTRAGEYGPDVRERLLVGAFVSGPEYLTGQRVRGLIRDEMDRVLSGVDVLIAPTLPIAATPVGAALVDIDGTPQPVRPSLIRYTRPFNASGHPAASVPCGFTADGLPIGMQVIGRSFDEATVLRVADAYQRATDWHTRRPPAGS
jgi:aspartyl-tRNA(Asn)/glutamyl-tRNA(Gln) amidotransferase subunit A